MYTLYTTKEEGDAFQYVQERFKTCLGRNQFKQSRF